MAKQARARRSRPVRAWALIRFRKDVARSVRRLSRVEVAPGWPGAASLKRVDRVRPFRTSGRRQRRYHTFAEIHAADRGALGRAIDYLEAHFSHMDVYEF